MCTNNEDAYYRPACHKRGPGAAGTTARLQKQPEAVLLSVVLHPIAHEEGPSGNSPDTTEVPPTGSLAGGAL